jgi:hypothetical protein
VSRRVTRLAADIDQFVRQYGRQKGPPRQEANDRKYDRKVEHAVKHMDPAELDAFLRGEIDDDEVPAAGQETRERRSRTVVL